MLPPDMQNYVTCWFHEEGTAGWLVTQIKSSHGLLFWAMFEHFEIHSLVLCKYYEMNKYFPDRPRRSQTWRNSADVSWSQWGFFIELVMKNIQTHPSFFLTTYQIHGYQLSVGDDLSSDFWNQTKQLMNINMF